MISKKALEWFGVITAIAYSMLVASNTGNEVLGFTLLFISAVAIAVIAFTFVLIKTKTKLKIKIHHSSEISS